MRRLQDEAERATGIDACPAGWPRAQDDGLPLPWVTPVLDGWEVILDSPALANRRLKPDTDHRIRVACTRGRPAPLMPCRSSA
ncbi:hypothetical protein [Nonomuraea sp. NPDC049709]|uniref:hypothetical protein n=1 Tax=Nonomuraea sp. NPDC049709 TaxID=3154736 RepID=UPI003422658B